MSLVWFVWLAWLVWQILFVRFVPRERNVVESFRSVVQCCLLILFVEYTWIQDQE